MTRRYSHPGERGRDPVDLRDHLEDVAERVKDIVPEGASTPWGTPLVDVLRRLAWIHDFGKLTTWFQQHIGVVGGSPEGPTHHAPMGALLAYYVLDVTDHDDEECLVGYVTVARHHSSLPDVAEFVWDRTSWGRRPAKNRTQREVQQQVDEIDETVSDLADEIVDEASSGEGSWDQFAEQVRDESQFDTIRQQVTYSDLAHSYDELSRSFYPTLVQAWSGLVLADKTSAAAAPRSAYEGTMPPLETLEAYIDGLQTDGEDRPPREQRLNEYRSQARESVLDNVESFAKGPNEIATLTLPTGMGKTLTGLNAALTLRDLTDRDRVVYALPFTSIIDQVADEVSTVFDADERADMLTIHHHLAETVTETDAGNEDDEDTDARARVEEMLGESWRSGLTITTFVQLFESLAGPKNTQSMKLPALYDSVIVLDEPQSLPHDWWSLVRRLIEMLVDEYDATVLAMTATRPRLFGEDSQELVVRPEQYFKEIERVEYALHPSFEAFPDAEDGPLDYESAASELVEASTDIDSILAVCNTIDSAKQLTEAVDSGIQTIDVGNVLADQLGNGSVSPAEIAAAVGIHGDDPALLHLTTRLRPRDRLTLIQVAKELTARGHPLIVVSTQLIEAGVDISFDAVYRDFAPMDSIVQAAGRCNRSFERDRGRVTVWWLDAPSGKETTPGEAVYNKWADKNSLLSLTDRAIESVRKEGAILEEPTLAWKGVRTYYDLLSEREPGKQEWMTLLDTARGEQLGEKSLIEQRLAVDVIVCRTATERERIEQIREAWQAFEFEMVSALLDNTRRSQVSVPIYTEDSEEAEKIEALQPIHSESDVRFLDARKGRYESYFDATTGLVLADDTVERRFL